MGGGPPKAKGHQDGESLPDGGEGGLADGGVETVAVVLCETFAKERDWHVVMKEDASEAPGAGVGGDGENGAGAWVRGEGAAEGAALPGQEGDEPNEGGSEPLGVDQRLSNSDCLTVLM